MYQKWTALTKLAKQMDQEIVSGGGGGEGGEGRRGVGGVGEEERGEEGGDDEVKLDQPRLVKKHTKTKKNPTTQIKK